ncbi:hypothetical protein SDJN02_06179, partial [Cucurbita argyrosperma subsp. argyrosperma]
MKASSETSGIANREISGRVLWLLQLQHVYAAGRDVAWNIFKVTQARIIRTANLQVTEHLTKIRSFFLEPGILQKNLFMAIGYMVQFVYQFMVLGAKPKNLRPKLIKISDGEARNKSRRNDGFYRMIKLEKWVNSAK